MYDQACRDTAMEKLLELRVTHGATAPGSLKDGNEIYHRVYQDLRQMMRPNDKERDEDGF